MKQKDGKVDRVEVGDRRVKQAGQGPGERHEYIADIVEVSGPSPKSGEQELGAVLGFEVFGLFAPNFGVFWIASELIFLVVDGSEDRESEDVESDDTGGG